MFKQCLVIFVFVIWNIILTVPASNYGESKLAIANFTVCKGPKRKDCSITTIRVVNDTYVSCKMQILQDVVPDKGRIISFKDGKLVMRLQTKNPCDHLYVRPIFRAAFNVTKECGFKKGNYSFNLNMEELEKLEGGFSMYKNIHTKALFYNDDCNFACAVIDQERIPKTKRNV